MTEWRSRGPIEMETFRFSRFVAIIHFNSYAVLENVSRSPRQQSTYSDIIAQNLPEHRYDLAIMGIYVEETDLGIRGDLEGLFR
jgi:BarA-like signal transduction histidine kinase